MNKLLEYGFKPIGDSYVYTCPVKESAFLLEVHSDGNKLQSYRVIDPDTDEEYEPFRRTDYAGAYVAKLRNECDDILSGIQRSCFSDRVFEEQQSMLLCRYIKDKYGDDPEYPFEDENAIFRNPKTGKWYAALLTVKANRVGLKGEKPTEVLNLKDTPERVAEIVDGIDILPAYHMNKKHWYTVRLDGSLPLEKICGFVDRSYEIIDKRKR